MQLPFLLFCFFAFLLFCFFSYCGVPACVALLSIIEPFFVTVDPVRLEHLSRAG